jgi:hypothetical protein
MLNRSAAGLTVVERSAAVTRGNRQENVTGIPVLDRFGLKPLPGWRGRDRIWQGFGWKISR